MCIYTYIYIYISDGNIGDAMYIPHTLYANDVVYNIQSTHSIQSIILPLHSPTAFELFRITIERYGTEKESERRVAPKANSKHVLI